MANGVVNFANDTTQADATTGAWSITVGAPANGVYSYTATATDAAGTSGSRSLNFTVDTTAPSAPTIRDSSVHSGVASARAEPSTS